MQRDTPSWRIIHITWFRARKESWKPICWRCPSIADGEISIKVNPLSMGDREDPARLVFTSKTGHGIAASLVDLD